MPFVQCLSEVTQLIEHVSYSGWGSYGIEDALFLVGQPGYRNELMLIGDELTEYDELSLLYSPAELIDKLQRDWIQIFPPFPTFLRGDLIMRFVSAQQVNGWLYKRGRVFKTLFEWSQFTLGNNMELGWIYLYDVKLREFRPRNLDYLKRHFDLSRNQAQLFQVRVA